MPTVKDNPVIEESEVFAWRREHWVKLGWNAAWADFLAGTGMDLARSRKLLEQGATHEQVLRILGGTDAMGNLDYTWDSSKTP